MSLTAGTLSQVSVGSTTANLSATAATGGTGPYTQQWYRSTTSGFSPGGGNIITGATGLTLSDSGLIPNTNYFYKVVYTDTGNGNTTVNSSQLAVTTSPPALNPNQFAGTPLLGTLDELVPIETISGAIDLSLSASTPAYAGQLVKLVAQSSSNAAPKVTPITANTDKAFGVIVFDIKSPTFGPGARCELALSDYVYMYATGAITQGSQVCPDITTVGGVQAATGSSNNSLIGWALDGASAAGQLIRVRLTLPTYSVD